MPVVSLLSGVFAGLLGGATGVSVTWNLVITAAAAIAAVVYAAIARCKKEPRAGWAMLMGVSAIVVTVFVIAI